MKRASIVIGTRGSQLALRQTGMVAGAVGKITGHAVETAIVKTQGDRIQDVPLHLVEGKGFFTKEIEEALLHRRIDLAVHSLKDLPTESPAGLTIAAIPAREMANDLLLVREDAVDARGACLLPPNPTVGTSSKRRALQIKALHPGVRIKELRGNVPTRIEKLSGGQYDAIILAAAGFRRLGIAAAGYRVVTLDLDAMLPAPGQGALALQVREEDHALRRLLVPLHDAPTAAAVAAERNVLELLGGGCGMPLGVYAKNTQGGLYIRALLGPEDWQLHDEPQYARAEAAGASPLEAAHRTVQALSVHGGG